MELGAQNGLLVPLIAVHLFVFYFGIMADVTPPVGLASFAAAAVSGGDPIKTGFTAFFYSLRTVILPFLFIFNTDLLLIGVGFLEGVFIFIKATIAMLIFGAATQGYFFARSKIWESLVLLLVAFSLFRPGFWLDMVQERFETVDPTTIEQIADERPAGGAVRVIIEGADFDNPDQIISKTLRIPLGEEATGAEKLAASGIVITVEGDKALLDEPFPGTFAFEERQGFDFYADEPTQISEVQVEADRLPKEVFYIPAILLLIIVVLLQRRRADKPAF